MAHLIKAGVLAAATSSLLLAAPLAPASAAPLSVAPASQLRVELPVDNVRYRKHVAQKRHYVKRHRHYSRHYRRGYGVNPGLAIFGTVLGAVAAANAYDRYDYGYPAYGYGYPAYSYPAYGHGYPAYGYGGGWGGAHRVYGGQWGSGWRHR